MVNQLMDFRKIEEKKLSLDYSMYDFSVFVHEICNSFASQINSKKIKFSLVFSHDPALIQMDYDKMDKILYNLLSNALKFTPRAGEIQLIVSYHFANSNLSGQSDYFELMVKDNGVGIPEEKLNNLFVPFAPSHTQTDVNQQSSGIGLALVKELVEMQNGTITVNSKVEVGSVFTIRLPLIDPYKITETPDNPNLEINSMPEEDSETSTSSVYKILIVEDEDEIRNFLTIKLKRLFQIYTAENGLVGFQVAKKVMPDLIITDLMMPVVDGYKLINKLKTDIRTSHIPILVLSAKNSVQSTTFAYKQGVIDFVSKPFNIDVLRFKIQNLLASFNELKKQYASQITTQTIPTLNDSTVDQKFMKQVVEIAHKNISKVDFDVASFAKELVMSRGHFYRKLLALTNQSPVEFIKLLRLKRAEEMLIQTNHSVTEIAFKTGFRSQSYFTKCFVAQYKVSPSAFVKQNKKT